MTNAVNARVKPKFDDNDIVAFAQKTYPDLCLDHMRYSDVLGDRLYRLGSNEDDDMLHLLVSPDGKYTAYLPNNSGAMKVDSHGVISKA